MIAANPLAGKELAGIARRWQTYVGRGLYIALVGAVVAAVWQTNVRHSDAISPSQAAEIGRYIFLAFFGIQMAYVALAAISVPAETILKEVRSGTLGLLALTPLTARRIVFGKWLAAMAQVGTVLLCGLPVLSVSIYLGGVGLEDLLWGFSLPVAMAMLGTSMSLLYSTIFRTGTIVILTALGTLFLWILLPMLMAFGGRSEETFVVFCFVHPVFSAGAIAALRSGAPLQGVEHSWWVSTLASAGVAFVLLRIAAGRVADLVVTPPGESMLTRTFKAMDRFYEGVTPKRFVFGRDGGVWERNAMLWKELRTRASGRLRNATRIGMGLLLFVILPLSLLMGDGVRHADVPALWMSAIMLLFMAVGGATGLFAREKEERKWEILLATPVSGAAVLRAKFLAGLAGLLPLAAILALLFTGLCAARGVGLAGWLVTGGTVGIFVLFAYVLGMTASLRARSTRAAYSITSLVLLLLLMILPLILALWSGLTDGRWDEEEFPYLLVTATNPAMFLSLFSRVGYRYSYTSVSGLWDADVIGWFAVYAATYGTAIVLLWISMRRRFDRWAGRN